MALPVPAQFTRMRSWPLAARAFLNPLGDAFVVRHVHFAEHAADFGRDLSPLSFCMIEDRDLHAVLGEQRAPSLRRGPMRRR